MKFALVGGLALIWIKLHEVSPRSDMSLDDGFSGGHSRGVAISVDLIGLD